MKNGQWHDTWYDTQSTGGEFVREETRFRDWVLPASREEPGNQPTFPAEKNRYHLFVSMACPWAHRTLIFRSIKRLENIISVSIVDPRMLKNGWVFRPSDEDDIVRRYNVSYLYQIYLKARHDYSGRVTVPVLWDKKTDTIVNNESSEIIRMLNSAFNAFTDDQTDYYPKALRQDIDSVNAFIYQKINNGVYRCGFATSQEAYEIAFNELFDALDNLDTRLSKQRYLVGSRLTEADWRFFTTLLRFDVVYYGHFKANKRRIIDYRHLHNYMLDLYQYPGVRKTVNFDHIKTHYYYSHDTINPTRIVPNGPEINLDIAHDRDRFEL